MPNPAFQCVLAAVVAFPLSAWSAAAAGEDQEVVVQMGAQRRTCMVHLPPQYDGKRPLPLLVAFHGAGGTGMGFLAAFSGLADRHGFIAACPDGIMGKNRGWNALWGKPVPGGHGAQIDEVDDIGFARALIDQLHESYHTDPLRVFVCGHSAGGYMSYRVAVDLAGRIAAAGVVNGSMGIRLFNGEPSVSDIPLPAVPVSVIHICGAKDLTVKYGGMKTAKALARSAADCVRHFVKADGCSTPGKETRDAAHGVTRTLYSGGRGGTEVELVVVENCGHEWPGPRNGLVAGQELWEFFSRHPKQAAASSAPHEF